MKKIIPGILIVLTTLFMMSCQQGSKDKPANDNPNSIEVIAKEVLQAQKYTYVLAEGADMEYWVAIPTAEIEVGETYYHAPGMLMKDFHSKDLDRDFEEVYFLQMLSKEPLPESPVPEQHTDETQNESMDQKTGAHIKTEAAAVSVKPAEDGITIAELFENKEQYGGQEVVLRGQVVKINENIMDRNWVHIQDGTEFDGNYDLVITTDEIHEPGAVVTFEGVVALDKDFGAGYVYDVIVEEGKARIK